jgi:hypothetical protein
VILQIYTGKARGNNLFIHKCSNLIEHVLCMALYSVKLNEQALSLHLKEKVSTASTSHPASWLTFR